jgi:hypothetical protein
MHLNRALLFPKAGACRRPRASALLSIQPWAHLPPQRGSSTRPEGLAGQLFAGSGDPPWKLIRE